MHRHTKNSIAAVARDATISDKKEPQFALTDSKFSQIQYDTLHAKSAELEPAQASADEFSGRFVLQAVSRADSALLLRGSDVLVVLAAREVGADRFPVGLLAVAPVGVRGLDRVVHLDVVLDAHIAKVGVHQHARPLDRLVREPGVGARGELRRARIRGHLSRCSSHARPDRARAKSKSEISDKKQTTSETDQLGGRPRLTDEQLSTLQLPLSLKQPRNVEIRVARGRMTDQPRQACAVLRVIGVIETRPHEQRRRDAATAASALAACTFVCAPPSGSFGKQRRSRWPACNDRSARSWY